jgi:hypothetical protein
MGGDPTDKRQRWALKILDKGNAHLASTKS